MPKYGAGVEHDPSRMVLLGVEPTEPEVDYGYIVPGEKTEDLSLSALHDVHRFVEKPDPHTALALKRAGGLWNTFVMVFRARTLLALVENIAPEIYALFRRIGEAIGEAREETVVQENYRAMPCLNFSKGLLEPATVVRRGCLSVLPVRGVRWSDWGSGRRIVNVLKKTGHLGRLKGISEERLFTIWSRLDRQSERSAGYKAPGRRRAYAGNS
jgi:mannose-1-phosphate guanylyltransferase